MRVCDIKKLVSNSNLSLQEKVDLKIIGRPTPVLNIVREQKECKSRQAFIRKFHKNVYNKATWLCGCDESDAFYCFVCLIFGGHKSWTKIGIRDLNLRIKLHENSRRHKQNLVSFQLLGNVSRLSEEQIHSHNETVEKNRLVVSKIIDILKLCGTCNVTVPDKSDLVNKGACSELVEFSRKLDPDLDKHLSDSRVFNPSKAIQNELLDCMFEVCREHILQEIENSSFLVVMSENTTDISTQCEMALVFRYELNGQVFERFWGFFNPEGQDADWISKCILRQLELVLKNSPNKLIGHTYDGTESVNVKIKEIYKNAHFVYCYAHQFNKLLEQAVSSISSVRIFFLNLHGIANFFSNSPDRTAALRDVCDTSQMHWSTNSQIVQTIFTFKDEILTCFENIQIGYRKKFNAETTMQAAGFVKWLEDNCFLFWLKFFSKVMLHVDILCNQLQEIPSYSSKIQAAVAQFKEAIENIQIHLPPVEDNTSHDSAINLPRKRLNDENLKLSSREVCDIIFQTGERFAFKDHRYGEDMFLREKYTEYQKNLPLNDIEKLCETFPSIIEKHILVAELNIFYSQPEIIYNSDISGCLKTLDFILSLGLDTAFREITKTLRILVTIPMKTAEPNRCFSKLRHIKTFVRNTMCEDRLSALGMLSSESAMIQKCPDFNKKVIRKFIADKEKRMDFHFKR